jgi:hypothetical protein
MLARPFVGFVILVWLLAQCGAPGDEARQDAASPSPVTAAPPPAVSPTRGPKPSSKPKPSPKPSSCPSPALRGVYHQYRLQVLGTCRTYRGVVIAVRPEEDGDYHVVVRPDPGFGRFLNQDNRTEQHGGLVTEIMPGQRLGVPFVGEHVEEFGTWVLDLDHGWQEIHPIWSITYLDTGTRMFSLPPVPPRYIPGGGGGSGGGGGGNCDPAYPTVCIPPPPPDLDCSQIPYRNFKVLPPDPHGFDGDHDGIGCET